MCSSSPGLLADQFSWQQPQPRQHDAVQQHQPPVPQPGQPPATLSDPAATTATAATTTAGSYQEYSVADQHQQHLVIRITSAEHSQQQGEDKRKWRDSRECWDSKGRVSIDSYSVTWWRLFLMISLHFQDNFNYVNQSGGSSSSSSSRGGGLVSISTSASSGSGPTNQGKMPQAIREFLKTLDDQEWQSSLFTLLQNQTFNQVNWSHMNEMMEIILFIISGWGWPVRADV